MIFFDEKKSRKGIFLLVLQLMLFPTRTTAREMKTDATTAALPFGSKEDHLRE